MKSDTELATLFAALAHPIRIAILRCLLTRAFEPQRFGDLSKNLGVAPSTLTHHLREMEGAGVLIRTPEGRTTSFLLNLSVLTDVVTQLSRLCCPAEPLLDPSKGSLP